MSLDQQPNSLAPVHDIFTGNIVATDDVAQTPFVLSDVQEAVVAEITELAGTYGSSATNADVGIATLLMRAANRS